MKKNDILNGICVDYTHDGLGIVKSNDFTFFIRNVLKGEQIRFIVTKLKKTYGYGKCIEVLQPSCDRKEPFCPYYGRKYILLQTFINSTIYALFLTLYVLNNIGFNMLSFCFILIVIASILSMISLIINSLIMESKEFSSTFKSRI